VVEPLCELAKIKLNRLVSKAPARL